MYLSELTIGQALVIAVVGLVVVFVVLVILMSIIKVMSAAIGSAKKKEAPAAPAPAAPAPAAAAAPAGLTLENVSEKEAALIMAIVADEMKKDPAELNFISIKEVK